MTLAPHSPNGSGEHRTHLLSKSTYLRGHQCPKALSLYTHRRELMHEESPAQQAASHAGTEIGVLAQSLFPGGIDVRPASDGDVRDGLARTAAALSSGSCVLYEASFVHEEVLATVDILCRDDAGWRAYEVKSTSRVKRHHIDDATLQYYVLTSGGLGLHDISIVHLNTQYIRQGELDLTSLFQITSVRDAVRAARESVPGRIAAFKAIVQSRDEPAVAVGNHCTTPSMCAFHAYCWRHEPAAVRGSKRVDGVQLQRFLSSLQYPLYFLDFETFSSAIPLFDGTRAYMQIPFQFSVHRQSAPGAPVSHQAFLADGVGDPREQFVEALLHAIGPVGDIVAYHLPFEDGRLRELGECMPRHRVALDALRARGKDLLQPFRKGWYYDPAMGMSNSIKSVLPALVPDLRYDALAISNGDAASRLFLDLLRGRYRGDVQALRTDLLAYCELDTLAMVHILGVLSAEASQH
jgi:hypothetical protein